MKTFENKTAFVTGAASGIGLALTKALVAEGANVMMADINTDNLEAAFAVIDNPARTSTIICDVADHTSVAATAKATLERFGQVDLLFNNAGVGLAGKSGNIATEDWKWIVDINLMGVVYGVEVFLPHMLSRGGQGHIINTASMAGHMAAPYMAPYNATKFAVVGYSEGLKLELENTDIGISVLCPTWIKSNIYNASASRPSLGGKGEDNSGDAVYQQVKHVVDNGMDPEIYAALTLNAIKENRFYVFNDPKARAMIDTRRNQILSDYDACLAYLDM